MKSNKHNCDLQSCTLCTGCLKEWLPAIEANRTTNLIKKGAALFNEGDKVEGMYFINKGKIKIHKKWGDDKELIVRIAGDGAIVGHRGMGGEGVYPMSATALEASTVCFVTDDFFHATLKTNHEFAYNLLMFFADELQVSEKNMRNLAHMPVKGRLAQALVSLQEKFGITPEGFINCTLSRQDLASLVGTAYETLFRMLNELEEENIIAVSPGKDIRILSNEKLMQLMIERS